MKGVMIAIFLFLAMLGCVVGNKLYLTETASDFLTQIEELKDQEPKETATTIKTLRSAWEEKKGTIQISVTHIKIDTVTEHFDSLCIYATSGAKLEYQKTAELLINALEEIKRFEEFSADNIL